MNQLGKDLSRLTLDDLQPVDEFHIRGDAATRELIALPASFPRYRLPGNGHCVAERLTGLLHMEDRVRFCAASALDLPFEDDTFDGCWSLQMNMNVQDKVSWLAETGREVEPGGHIVLYEVCAGENTPLHFPVPRAQGSSMSFLLAPDDFRKAITSASLDIEVWNDKTDPARAAFANIPVPEADVTLPALGVYMLVGEDIRYKAYNLQRNLDEGRVSLIEAVAIKPERT